MNYQILICLAIDFARGVHLWPLLEWLNSLFNNWLNDLPLIVASVEVQNINLHLIVAFLVAIEAAQSIMSKKNH